MSLSSLAALSADPREQEVRMLVQLVRLSRVTVLLAETGSDKTAVVRSSVMPLLEDQGSGATKDVAVVLDSWSRPPLVALNARIDEALARSVGSVVSPGEASAATLSSRLAALQQTYDRTFIIVFDRFEEFLAAPSERPDIREFESQFVEAVNSRTLRANFLLSLDEDAAPFLGPLGKRIPGLGDARVRLPKLSTERADNGIARALAGDELIGSAAGAPQEPAEAADSKADAAESAAKDASEQGEARRAAFAAMFFGSEAERQPFRGGASLAERVASLRAGHPTQQGADVEPGASTLDAPFQEPAAAQNITRDRAPPAVSAGEPVGPIAEVAQERREPFVSAESGADARSLSARSAPPRPARSVWPRAIAIGVALAVISALIVLGMRRVDAPVPVPTQTGAPAAEANPQAAQSPTDQQAQTDVPAAPGDETPLRSEDVYATPKDDTGEWIEPPVASPPTQPSSVAAAPPATASEAAAQPAQAERPANGPATTAPARLAERTPEASAPVPAGPLLYIHIRREAQRAHAERMIEPLARHGVRVSGIKLLSYGPPVSDLRYFRSSDREEALRVNRALDAIGAPAQRLKFIGGFEKTAPRRQYELWLPPA